MEEKKLILVVEDNIKNLRLVNDILESQGYKVLQAQGGKEGIALAQEKRPDLIIMDIQMPDLDGLLATAILKEDARTADIPVVALTALVMRGDQERILKAGCDGYMQKPVRFDVLVNTVKEWL